MHVRFEKRIARFNALRRHIVRNQLIRTLVCKKTIFQFSRFSQRGNAPSPKNYIKYSEGVLHLKDFFKILVSELVRLGGESQNFNCMQFVHFVAKHCFVRRLTRGLRNANIQHPED